MPKSPSRSQPALSTHGAAQLRRELLEWFAQAKRDLPWRRTSDPYAIWVSEVMLQQTQVDRVKGYWAEFLKHFPSVEALARAELASVLSRWKGLGYYSRAKNLHRAAQAIVERHGGELPKTVDGLLSLPGFGRYTAGAVASIAHGVPAPIVDGNVARVLSRVCAIDGAPGDKQRDAQLWSLAALLADGERPGELNQALMELGALICTPSCPTCLLCPVRQHCQALAQGRVDELPQKRAAMPRKALHLAVGIASKGQRLLMARREERGLFGGLWEPPSIEAAADAEEALRRLLGKKVKVVRPLGVVERTLTHRDLTLSLYELQGVGAVRALPGYCEWRYVAHAELDDLGMSSATQAVLAQLISQRQPAKKPSRAAAGPTERRERAPRRTAR